LYPDLRHQSVYADELLSSSAMPEPVRILYNALILLAGSGGATIGAQNVSDQSQSSAGDILQGTGDLAEPCNQRVSQLLLSVASDNPKYRIFQDSTSQAIEADNDSGYWPEFSLPETPLVFPQYTEPKVSIVIPTYNGAALLLTCLRSVLQYTRIPYELIIVDDASTDKTDVLLQNLVNVTVLRNDRNLDFLRSTRNGVARARGEYLLFLNNDTSVRQGWLEKMVETMESYEKCAVVGAKLVNWDGTLQEAGTVVWSDGNVNAYGAGDDPFKPEYCYVREVDYCAGACLLVRRSAYESYGGLDEIYAPAYYEDPDLCFGLRDLGYVVVYQPDVSVFHHVSGSRDLEKVRMLCSVNREKFVGKWDREMLLQPCQGSYLKGRDTRKGPRVLVVAGEIPDSVDGIQIESRNILQQLGELGAVITYLPIIDQAQVQPTTHQWQQDGVEVLYGEDLDPGRLVEERVGLYHAVVVFDEAKNEHLQNFLSQYLTDVVQLSSKAMIADFFQNASLADKSDHGIS
jgi:GT2 family glycosyltransferase